MEKTLVIIKPDGIEKGLIGEVLGRIKKNGLKISKKMRKSLSKGECETLYEHAKAKYPKIYSSLISYMTRGPVILMEIEGERAIERMIELRGPSDPSKAPFGTVRGDFSREQSMKEFYKRGKAIENIMHSSQNQEEAEFEIGLFFKNEA